MRPLGTDYIQRDYWRLMGTHETERDYWGLMRLMVLMIVRD